MKISIITPTYNSAATVRDTLESVLSQQISDLEYIIIDGASSDNTLQIIEEYQERLKIKLISESDHGLYDAMNKGIELATGDIIGIINSDDFYKNGLILKKIIATFSAHSEIDACYGDLAFVETTNCQKIVRYWRAGKYNKKKLAYGWTIPHPTLFLKKELYQKYGVFRTDLSLASDYEFILRLFNAERVNVFYLPETLVYMRTGGSSSKNLKQRIRGWQELKKAWTINNLAIPNFFIFRRLLNKLGQYLKLQ